MVGLGFDPDPGEVVQAADVRKAEFGEGIDDELFDRAHIGHRVGHAAAALARRDQRLNQTPFVVRKPDRTV